MSSAPAIQARKGVTKPSERAPTALWVAFGVMGMLLAAYLVSLVVRPYEQTWPLLDGWMVCAFEFVAGGLCLARGFSRSSGRAIPLVLGAAICSWAAGYVALTVESTGGATPPTPSIADVFYVGFYPLAYAGVVLLLRNEVKRLLPATWLDGAIAGLGAAAVCASFAFPTILSSVGGNPVVVAVDLAYPIGDLLLLALVVGGSAMVSGRRAPWILFAVACAINGVGDTFFLYGSSGGSSEIGNIFNAMAWPTAVVLIAISVWVPLGRRNLREPTRAPGFLLPGLGACAGLGVLFFGAGGHNVGQVLATATMIFVGVRLALSVRGLGALTEQRQRHAVTDELTSLGNRRQLTAVLDAYFEDYADLRTPARSLAFLYVDLDHFKQVNDSFGHSAGDDVLRQLGPRLKGALRPSDVLVRIGGDEFGVVIIDSDPAYIAGVAQRLTALLDQPFALNAVTVHISASIGIAIAPADATDSVGLMRCADAAMYRAKLGERSFETYQPHIDDGGNRLALVDELRAAVDGGELLLHYQPQVDLRTGKIAGVEALVRWPHPRLGLVAPLDFLPLAEEAGLMGPLTALVLDRAIAQSAAWRATGTRVAMAVNLSSSNLLDPGFVDVVSRALQRYDVPVTAVILEITETTIIRDFEGCRHVIDELRSLGVGVSIDDFGSGFTSLAYLGSLAVTELKLDRTFIGDLAGRGRERDVTLVRATIELGHTLGLLVVAEGIEDAGTLELLAMLGCDRGQGYFTGRPVPAEDLELDARCSVSSTPTAILSKANSEFAGSLSVPPVHA